MDSGKYIIVEQGGSEAPEAPILFCNFIDHSKIAEPFPRSLVISAGQFDVGAEPTEKDPNDISVGVYGKSTTLKLKSRKEDAEIIKKLLRPPSPY